jgi:exopolyphosphatase/pppGpp-phosphohydrolase
MAEHFAVVDVGSNAMRFQVASVMDRGRHYRIIHQDRKPVRLSHRVFQTGSLIQRSPTQRSRPNRVQIHRDRHG